MPDSLTPCTMKPPGGASRRYCVVTSRHVRGCAVRPKHMSVLPPEGGICQVLAFVCADDDPLGWAATITTLLAAGSAVRILAGGHVDTA